ncbi:unnamed protein product [marine sediment metagenome]|uniref:Glycosyltransferase subfamily 4-like N-terminal domain-containing protein n=1 Tax=marine sediment metagenome TaxID=412755 RepID=X1AP33_9ZZZZ
MSNPQTPKRPIKLVKSTLPDSTLGTLENPIKLIAYRGDRAACWFYRLHTPLIYLAQSNPKTFQIVVASAITKDHLAEYYDIIILQRQYKMDVLAPILEQKKKGSKLIYEIDDDLFNIPDWNPAKRVLGKKSVQTGVKRFLNSIDALFVTTETLRDTYKNYCEHIYVLPNSIDYSVLYKYPKNSVLQ